jgi:hypothetical protein
MERPPSMRRSSSSSWTKGWEAGAVTDRRLPGWSTAVTDAPPRVVDGKLPQYRGMAGAGSLTAERIGGADRRSRTETRGPALALGRR